MSYLNDDTSIENSKYKTIRDIKNAPIRSQIQTICKMKSSEKKKYMSKWLFEKYYLNKKLFGNLTDRVKKISNSICYDCITNFRSDEQIIPKTKMIMSIKSVNMIRKIHSFSPSMVGTFIDYVMRRMICEISGTPFYDTRSDKILRKSFIIYGKKEYKNWWKFEMIRGISINRWFVFESPSIKSKKIASIKNRCVFVELEKYNEWLKIRYNEIVGWVRYLVPKVEKTLNIEGDINDYVPNKWFKKIDNNSDKNHICKKGCKYEVPGPCELPLCQNLCHERTKNTSLFQTVTILKEILITSLCHSEWFGGCPNQEQLKKIFDNVNNKFVVDFAIPLYDVCEKLVNNSSKILLNPALGWNGKYGIPSDCDIIVDKTIIDIKCSKKNNTYEVMQLLGYAALLKYNPNYEIEINNICIINVLQGKCTVYNIEKFSNIGLFQYLKLLNNCYDKKDINDDEIFKNTLCYPIFFDKFIEKNVTNGDDNVFNFYTKKEIEDLIKDEKIRIKKLKFTNPNQTSFFRYYLNSKFGLDLSRYRIYSKKNFDKTEEQESIDCLGQCILNAVSDGMIEMQIYQKYLNIRILNEDRILTVATNKLTRIGKELEVNFVVHKLNTNTYYPSKHIIGRPILHIAIYKNHFFTYEKYKPNVKLYAIRNFEKVTKRLAEYKENLKTKKQVSDEKLNKKWYQVSNITTDNKIKFSSTSKACCSSLNLVISLDKLGAFIIF